MSLITLGIKSRRGNVQMLLVHSLPQSVCVFIHLLQRCQLVSPVVVWSRPSGAMSLVNEWKTSNCPWGLCPANVQLCLKGKKNQKRRKLWEKEINLMKRKKMTKTWELKLHLLISFPQNSPNYLNTLAKSVHEKRRHWSRQRVALGRLMTGQRLCEPTHPGARRAGDLQIQGAAGLGEETLEDYFCKLHSAFKPLVLFQHFERTKETLG